MSNFKLDFDISTHRRATPLKPRKPVAVSASASASSSSASVAADSDVGHTFCAATSTPIAHPVCTNSVTADATATENKADTLPKREAKAKKAKGVSSLLKNSTLPRLVRYRYLLALIVIVGLWLWLVPAVKVAAPVIVKTVSQCQRLDDAVTCRSACAVRGDCHSPRVVAFESNACADEIHTVLLHNSRGDARRVPAFYLRVPNTTMFEFRGDRGIFRPAHCKAEMRSVVVRSTPIPKKQPLEGQLWWISGKSVHTFEIVRGDKIIAQLDASLVLHACYSRTHCVFKIPMPCAIAKKAHVFETVSSGQKKTETFVFC